MLTIQNYKNIIGKQITTANQRNTFEVTEVEYSNWSVIRDRYAYRLVVVDISEPVNSIGWRPSYQIFIHCDPNRDKTYSLELASDNSQIKLTKSELADIDVVLRTVSYLIEEYQLRLLGWGFPKAKRVKAQTIAQHIVPVQPMSAPTGMIFAPYIPLMTTPTITSGSISGSLATRYSKKTINKNLYGTVKVSGKTKC